MRIKLDENMPAELVELLDGLGHETHTVPQEMPSGDSDTIIRRAARLESRFLITQDKKFVDKRWWQDDPGAEVMLLRLGNAPRTVLVNITFNAFRVEPVEPWIGKIVVVTRNKVRVSPFEREGRR